MTMILRMKNRVRSSGNQDSGLDMDLLQLIHKLDELIGEEEEKAILASYYLEEKDDRLADFLKGVEIGKKLILRKLTKLPYLAKECYIWYLHELEEQKEFLRWFLLEASSTTVVKYRKYRHGKEIYPILRIRCKTLVLLRCFMRILTQYGVRAHLYHLNDGRKEVRFNGSQIKKLLKLDILPEEWRKKVLGKIFEERARGRGTSKDLGTP